MKRTFVVALILILILSACTGMQSPYRKKISIDHTKVFNSDLKNFPALITITDSALKSSSHGGHVLHDNGEDIYFTCSDGRTRIAHEVTDYNPATGALKAWVKVPVLSVMENTELYLNYGATIPEFWKSSESVWDHPCRIIEHLDNAESPDIDIPGSGGLNPANEITVQAWVYNDSYQPENLQPLVSKWQLNSSFDSFDAYDAGSTDGLKTIGFFGAVFDGRYVYFSPQRYGHEVDSTHGYALRYDTQKKFKDSASWEAYDAGNTDGLLTRGHYGAVFDGRYVYYVPRGKNYGGKTGTFNEFQSNLLRYDTHMNFKDSSSWAAYDMGVDVSKQSAAFDGRYIYFCPGYEHDGQGNITGSSKIIRFDTDSPFKDPSSYRTLDVNAICREEEGNYDGAAFDGRYVYFVPLYSGLVLRYDTTGDYEAGKNWSTYDAKPLGMQMNVGAMFDGRYLYFAAYGNGVIVRLDTHGEFTDDASWVSFDASTTDGLDTGGFDGGFYDGRYVYFAPFVSRRADGSGYNFHTNYLRHDTQKLFTNTQSWEAFDASATDGLATIGYNGGAFDGRYIYLAPWQDRTDGKFGIHGNVLRYDTVGENGTFILKYCSYGHNGGLTAAVPGPEFIVNTVNGPISIASHEVLLPGWHHVAGVYNGNTIKLFIDGVLVAERPGSGALQSNDIPVKIGRLGQGCARFDGIIDEVRVSTTARSDDWIKTGYNNLSNPGGFIQVGDEEKIR